jgi:23S rRNA pseudouridine1911/1915/1917 synthase
VIHVVTRLDRDTSGLMLFAKHGFAHAKLDTQLREKKFVKKYQALVSGAIDHLEEHGMIQAPIGQRFNFFIETESLSQMVSMQKQNIGLEKQLKEAALADIQLTYREEPIKSESIFLPSAVRF